MSRTRIAFVGLALFFVSFSLARGDDKPASQPAKVQPVDFHKLKELMPADAVGVQRSGLDGQNTSIGEMTFSKANADYTKPDSDGTTAHASIDITDYGASPQMLTGMAAWRSVPMNIENDQGYQRTVKFKDYPAFQSYTKDGDSRQMMIVVAERFLVTIETAHVTEADFKKFVESLPLEKLEKLVKEK